MKKTIFTLLLLSVIIISCRKDKNEQTIQQYDQSQIQNYIASNGITGMIKDTSGGDTTGMYYKIINPGSGPALAYSDKIFFVFSLRTFDGTYVSTDTIFNHYYDYVGHITSNSLPLGVQLGVINLLKHAGASMRLLIPSRLAYGINGNGSGSSQVANNRIKGNESLDYYIHSIGPTAQDQAAYDDQVIQSYIKAQNLTGYTAVQSTSVPGNIYYYRILTPGTNTNDPITMNSTVIDTHSGSLLDNKLVDSAYNGTITATDNISGFVEPGVAEVLINHSTANTKISFILPSALGYGNVPGIGGLVPPNSCLRYTWQNLTVTP